MMNFDLYPHSCDSIVQPNGDVVIAYNRLIPAAIGGMVCIMSIFGTIEGVVAWGTLVGPLLVGGACFVLGIIGVFVRADTCVTREGNSVSRRWGIGRPEFTLPGARRLDEFDAVIYGDYEVSTDSGSCTVNFVGLHDPSNGRWYELTRVRDMTDSRQYGEAIAKALNLPLQREGSSAHARGPDQLDQKLVAQLDPSSLPPTPPHMLTTIEGHAGKLVISIPGPGTGHAAQATRKSIAVAMLTLCTFFMIGGMVMVPGIEWWMAGVAVLIALPMNYLVYRLVVFPVIRGQARQSAKLILDSHRLTIWERDRNGTESEMEYPFDELEEFYHDTKDHPSDTATWKKGSPTEQTELVVSSDHATRSIAGWLPHEEKEYLAALVPQLILQLNERNSGGNASCEDQLVAATSFD
ncbi:MAG: hypothetical protein KDB27_02175 [Planctomycetales bacterium]|nr:hypothetical protein [Planctomycetales bacterium]